MRISAGMMTFLVGLVLLALAGIIYQQSLAAAGRLGSASSGAAAAAQAPAKQMYICPMHPQVIQDHPGTCPICGMELVPQEAEASATTGSAGASQAAASQPAAQLYTCPMHPQVVQDHPGTCPICGMELVPKAEDTGQASQTLAETVESVKLSPTQAVLADVQAVMPTREKMALSVPAIGEVSVPQSQMKDIVSWQEGRVDNLLLAETGGSVQEGQHILDVYSEPLVQAQEEYLLALKAVNELGNSGYESIASSSKSLLEASRQKLLRLGLTADQLTELETKRTVEEHLPIHSLYGGVVMDKMVTQGMYVMRGEKLFSVADLSTVWVELSVFEKDVANIKVGDKVSLKCPIHPGMLFKGTVELLEPEVNMETRTFRVRVGVNNSEMLLRPGMILDAELTFDYGKLLLLPRNAVLHTGDGDLVYVAAGENMWVPRRVTVGRDFGDKVEIVSGLKPDEGVAATAVFLLDSEAQLKGIVRPVDSPGQPAQPQESAHAQH